MALHFISICADPVHTCSFQQCHSTALILLFTAASGPQHGLRQRARAATITLCRGIECHNLSSSSLHALGFACHECSPLMSRRASCTVLRLLHESRHQVMARLPHPAGPVCPCCGCNGRRHPRHRSRGGKNAPPRVARRPRSVACASATSDGRAAAARCLGAPPTTAARGCGTASARPLASAAASPAGQATIA